MKKRVNKTKGVSQILMLYNLQNALIWHEWCQNEWCQWWMPENCQSLLSGALEMGCLTAERAIREAAVRKFSTNQSPKQSYIKVLYYREVVTVVLISKNLLWLILQASTLTCSWTDFFVYDSVYTWWKQLIKLWFTKLLYLIFCNWLEHVPLQKQGQEEEETGIVLWHTAVVLWTEGRSSFRETLLRLSRLQVLL